MNKNGPIAQKDTNGEHMSHDTTTKAQIVDPVTREERARRELQMLRDMKHIQQQHFSNPTGSIVDIIYGDKVANRGREIPKPGGAYGEDGPRENTRPPDSGTANMLLDNAKANDGLDTTHERGPGAISSS